MREPRCAEGQQGPGVPGGHGKPGIWHWLGPGNTNKAGWVGTRYSTLPVPTRYTHPGTPSRYPPAVLPADAHAVPHLHTCGTAVLRSTKEILGVDNAHPSAGHTPGPQMAVSALPPPYAICLWALPWRLLNLKPQYISVYLSISQFISEYQEYLSISQYFSVFLSIALSAMETRY